jgi:hypothetical protein
MDDRCVNCGCKLTEKNTLLRYERWVGRLCDNCGELRAKIQNEIDRGEHDEY